MSQRELLKRYLFFIAGLIFCSAGVALITKASLGTSPITSIPYTLSLKYPLSLGTFTFIFNIFLIILQFVMLKKKFRAADLLQIPVTFLFSWFIDIAMLLFRFMNPESYFIKIVFMLIGCVVLGFGVFMEMVANVVMLPGEAFVRAFSITFGTDFGKTKICFDSSMCIIAAVMCLLFFHKLNGVREGTLIASVLVGASARQFKKYFGGIEKILLDRKNSENISNKT